MKTFFSRIFILLLAGCYMVSCETEESSVVDQDRIFTAYDLFYDEPADITFAKATFTLGNLTGTRLILSEGASITFGNETIPFNETLGFYEIQLQGYVQNGSFTYIDLNGDIYENTLSIRDVDFPDDLNTSIDQSSSYEIEWDGEPVSNSDGSSVVATVIPNNIGQTKIFTQANGGATSVILTANELEQIEPQNGTLILERFDLSPVQESPEVGGLLAARYRVGTNIAIE